MVNPKWQDEEWLERFRVESTREKAFRDLIRHFQPSLYAQTRRICPSHADCDDILQETFIKAWINLKDFRGDSKLSTWLYRIAYNETLNHLSKTRKQNISFAEIPEITGTSGFTPEEGNELTQRLELAIELLPPKQKLIFCYRYFEEMPYSEIAVIMGVTEGSLKASYHHAAQKVEDYLMNR
jgi:RNA polymerase sigma-70 factor (ECF subfamily)